MEVQLVQIGNSKGIVLPENYIKNLNEYDKLDFFLNLIKLS
jgi:antitoxin component of MazEF toxin-antitoxin module